MPHPLNAHFVNHIVARALPATPEISNMHFTYSLCAVKRRPRENRPIRHYVPNIIASQYA
ncbi:MAG: hypothetical protein ACFNQF_03865 [Bacteroides sp.]